MTIKLTKHRAEFMCSLSACTLNQNLGYADSCAERMWMVDCVTFCEEFKFPLNRTDKLFFRNVVFIFKKAATLP